MPGIGWNVAAGAKGKLFGLELSLNGGGYTLEPGSIPTDIGLWGLSGDFRFQPKFGIVEPFATVGLGGYMLHDAVIREVSGGLGVRAGVGADLRFDAVAIRLGYQFGLHAFESDDDAYGPGAFGARTEALSAGLVVYF